MNLANIGAILKMAIKERGLTQEEFAEQTGVGLSTLKKYMAGKIAYSIDVLDVFARYLRCSYDFLLGKSLTPSRELHDVKEATHLTDGALERITAYAKTYDTDSKSKKYLDTLSTVISYDFMFDRIMNYFYIDTDKQYIFEDNQPLPQPGIFVGEEYLKVPDLEDAYMLSVIRVLAEAKSYVGENMPLTLYNYKIPEGDDANEAT